MMVAVHRGTRAWAHPGSGAPSLCRPRSGYVLTSGRRTPRCGLRRRRAGRSFPSPLGRGAVVTVHRRSLIPSEVWVDGGCLYWGQVARRRRVSTDAPFRVGIKDPVTGRGVGINPALEAVGLDVDALLALWIGYLVSVGRTALEVPLESVADVESYRVSVPVSGGAERRTHAEAMMLRALRRALPLARFVRDRWQGLLVRDTLQFLRSGDDEEATGLILADPPVASEPLCAAGGQFLELVEQWEHEGGHDLPDLVRRLFLVADVGGGTTDLTLFQTFRRSGRDPQLRFAPIARSQDGVPVGGEDLVGLVRGVASSALGGIAVGSDRLDEIARRLARRVLGPSAPPAVRLREGVRIESGPVEDEVCRSGLTERVRAVRDRILRRALDTPTVQQVGICRGYGGARGRDWPIWTLVTGGGRHYRVFADLFSGILVFGDVSFELRPVQPRLPRRIGRVLDGDTLDLAREEYGQLAVAIGGVEDDLPDEAEELEGVVVTS